MNRSIVLHLVIVLWIVTTLPCMIGFTAEYVSGSITIDPHELDGAAWFPFESLPALPSRVSIARYLIDYAQAQAMNR